MSRVVRRSDVIKPAGVLVDTFDTDDIVRTVGDQTRQSTGARCGIDMTPAVAFVQPKKTLAVFEPMHLVNIHINPRVILFLEDGADLAGTLISNHYVQKILTPIELKQDDLIRITGPVHA